MTGVRSYSGILKRQDGTPVAISLIINNYSCHTKLLNEELKTLLVNLARK